MEINDDDEDNCCEAWIDSKFSTDTEGELSPALQP